MRSLSTRLTVFISVAMAVVLFALGAAIFTLLRDEVVQDAMRTAQSVAQATRQNFLAHGGDLDVLQADSKAYLFGARPDETAVQIVSPFGTVVAASQRPYLPVPVRITQSVQQMITWKGEPASYVSLPITYHGLPLAAVEVSVSLAASFGELLLLRALLIGRGEPKALLAVVGDAHRVALVCQGQFEIAREVAVVLHHENAHGQPPLTACQRPDSLGRFSTRLRAASSQRARSGSRVGARRTETTNGRSPPRMSP